MARIFAYIVHKGGVRRRFGRRTGGGGAEDRSGAALTAIVTGWGADLDTVCESLRATYSEIWKIAKEPLAYPNAELVRKALVQRAAGGQHPAGSACATSASISRRGFPSR